MVNQWHSGSEQVKTEFGCISNNMCWQNAIHNIVHTTGRLLHKTTGNTILIGLLDRQTSKSCCKNPDSKPLYWKLINTALAAKAASRDIALGGEAAKAAFRVYVPIGQAAIAAFRVQRVNNQADWLWSWQCLLQDVQYLDLSSHKVQPSGGSFIGEQDGVDDISLCSMTSVTSSQVRCTLVLSVALRTFVINECTIPHSLPMSRYPIPKRIWYLVPDEMTQLIPSQCSIVMKETHGWHLKSIFSIVCSNSTVVNTFD